jgi:hypothetical protein
MDFKKLQRDPKRVHPTLQERADGSLVTLTGCKIYVPVRYKEHMLADISETILIVGIFAMVVADQFYAVSLANARMHITPTSTTIVDVCGDDYYEFFFDKGQVVTPNVELVKEDTLAYRIYDEIVAKGHVPQFFNYEDLGKLFASSKYHAGITLASSNVPLEMIAASISRGMKDRTLYYRHVISKIEQQSVTPPAFIEFRSVMYGATDTTAKLMGSYFDEGVMSALVNPSEKTEGIEALLRQ